MLINLFYIKKADNARLIDGSKIYTCPEKYGYQNDIYVIDNLKGGAIKEEVDQMNKALKSTLQNRLLNTRSWIINLPEITIESVNENRQKTNETELAKRFKNEPIKRLNYFLQLKLAKDNILNNSFTETRPVKIGEGLGNGKKNGKCYCNRDFTVEEVKSLVKTIKGKESIWEGGKGDNGFEKCKIDDKSFEGLTKALNNSFRRHGINNCIQKIAILAETSIETGFFTCSEELTSKYASSKYLYKGRGLIQLTGSKDKNGDDLPGVYKRYKDKQKIKEDIISDPSLVAKKLLLAIDSGSWYFTYKSCPPWNNPTIKGKNNQDEPESDEEFKKRQKAYKWKREYFGDAAKDKMTLNQIANLMVKEEEKYFFLISKLCHGYDLKFLTLVG